ncbi:MAG: MBOAT family O-acyltransferase, partial [Flavobacteriales bacterium]
FRDYLYLQLSPKTKYLNVLLVFAIAGLWHGAGFNFLIWGCINGLFVLLVDPALNFVRRSQIGLFTICSKLMGHAVVYLSLVFFRSPSIEEAVHMFGFFYKWPRIGDIDLFTHFSQFGLGTYELIFGFAFMALVLSVEWMEEHRPEFSLSFFNGQGLYRWTAAFGLTMAIVLFGFYDNRQGNGEHTGARGNPQFLYEQF